VGGNLEVSIMFVYICFYGCINFSFCLSGTLGGS